MKQLLLPSLFLMLSVGLTSCRNDTPPERVSKIFKIGGCDNPNRELDVIFIHGVDGDHESTWHPEGKKDAFWPRWLAEDNPNIGVWSIDYPASSTINGDGTMALTRRADNLLSLFESKRFHESSEIPIVFVMHSFGGIVTKEMVRSAAQSENDNWQAIGRRTKGMVFIAVPNSGANIATFFNHIAPSFASATMDDLQKDEPNLLKLNRWFRDNAPKLGIKPLIFFETKRSSYLPIVGEASADPNIAGTEMRGIDLDHVQICKLHDRDSQVYDLTMQLIESSVRREPPPSAPPIPQGNMIVTKVDHDSTTPQIDPKKVLITIENSTNEKLTVILFDWSRYYSQVQVTENQPLPPAKTLFCWKEFDVNARQEFNFDKFSSGKGWYSILLRTKAGDYTKYLTKTNLFSKLSTRIQIKKVGNDYSASAK